MKKHFLFLFLLFITTGLFADAPGSFSYQSILRDASGKVLSNQNITIGISITNENSIEMFSETHSTTTNQNGLISLSIGSENQTLNNIEWGSGTYFITLFVDGVEMGTNQLLSVPFSMYSNKAKEAETLKDIESSFKSIKSQADRVRNEYNNPDITEWNNLAGASDTQVSYLNDKLNITGTILGNGSAQFRLGFDIAPINYESQPKTYVFVAKGTVIGSNIDKVQLNANGKNYLLVSNVNDNTETEFTAFIECPYSAGTADSKRYLNISIHAANTLLDMPVNYTFTDLFLYEKINGWEQNDYFDAVGKNIFSPKYISNTSENKEPEYIVWNALGNSITAADWMKYVGLLDGSRVYIIRNFGIGGTCLSTIRNNDGTSMYDRRLDFLDDQTTSVTIVDNGQVINGLFSDPIIAPYLDKVCGRIDLMTLAGGSNEIGYSYNIGSLDNDDPSTIVGAANSILKSWMKTYPLAKKMLILPPANDYSSRWGQNKTMKPIADALISVADFYSIPYVDGYYKSGINKYTMTGFENLYVMDESMTDKNIDTNGNIISETGSSVSGKIQIENITTLTTNQYNTRFACYDSSDNFLGVVNWSSAIMYQELNYPLPTGTKYVVGGFKTIQTDQIWVGNYDGALMPDRVHPNTAGQKKIATLMWSKMKEVFGY